MWSDNETAVDLLGFQHLVSAVTQIVRSENLLPATIGVFGDWGSGKSSLLRMASEQLGKDKDVLVLHFNGWLFEGYDDVKAALIGTIVDELVERRTVTATGRDLVLRLVKRINLLRVAGAIGRAALAYQAGGVAALGLSSGVDIATTAKELWDKAKAVSPEKLSEFLRENDPGQDLRRSIREFRKDFEDLLEDTKVKTLVVIIDDLDRCLPNTVIETLEAIKLFLFADRTAFILGADERLIRYAVRSRFPELPGDRVDVGRDYLEKLIQFPVRLPSLGRTEMETYINVLFAQRAGLTSAQLGQIREAVVNCKPENLLDVRLNHGVAKKILGAVPPALADQLNLAQRVAPVLSVGLAGNPRQAKRFLNALVMRIGMAKSRGVELKQRVLSKLMTLEYFRPESFKFLAQSQSEEQGRPRLLPEMEKAARRSPDGETNGASKEKGAKTENSELSHAASLWLSDPWLRDWLQSDPELANEDLRPYYYFARDSLGALGGTVQRMTPQAQEILAQLFGDSEAVRNVALRKAKNLNPGDVAAVFEALADRARQEEDTGADNSAMNRLIEWTEYRPELFSQLLTFLEELPESSVFPSAVPKLRGVLDASPIHKQQLKRVVERWARSTNSPLKAAATNALKAWK